MWIQGQVQQSFIDVWQPGVQASIGTPYVPLYLWQLAMWIVEQITHC